MLEPGTNPGQNESNLWDGANLWKNRLRCRCREKFGLMGKAWCPGVWQNITGGGIVQQSDPKRLRLGLRSFSIQAGILRGDSDRQLSTGPRQPLQGGPILEQGILQVALSKEWNLVTLTVEIEAITKSLNTLPLPLSYYSQLIMKYGGVLRQTMS